MTAQALRMPFAFVPDANDLLTDEHLAERGFFETVETQAGAIRIPGAPFKMSETPLRPSPPPVRGDANKTVLVDELGYELDDMTVLSDRGIT